MVFPQIPNWRPLKFLSAQRKKDSPIEKVFPLRTEPSQTMASNRLEFHQVRTCFCLGEKVISGLPIEVSGSGIQGLIKLLSLLTGAGFQEIAKGIKGTDAVNEFDFDAAAVRDTDFGDSGEVEGHRVDILRMECEFHDIVCTPEGQLRQSADNVLSAEL